jgi:hypothetical protein
MEAFTMPHTIDLYERTIVFVQRFKSEGIESFAKYADLDQIVKNQILPDIDLNSIDFGDDQGPVSKSIIFPNMNIKVLGHIDRLIISMEDAGGSDKYFYEASKNYSDALVKENISAIGVNFNGIVETKNADGIIKDKILNQCSPSILNNADTASFKLVHKDNDNKAFFTISLDAGAVKSSKGKKEGILISCNYHREIKTQQLMKAKMDEFQDSLEQVKVKFEEHKKNIEGFLNG